MEIKNKNIATIKTPEEIRKIIWQILETVSDPEVPVLSVIDLGVVREVAVSLTPPSGGWGVLWEGIYDRIQTQPVRDFTNGGEKPFDHQRVVFSCPKNIWRAICCILF